MTTLDLVSTPAIPTLPRAVRVSVAVIPGNQYRVSTVDADTECPLEAVFTTKIRSYANDERNRRCERWSETAEMVTGDAMPVGRFS